ncbi:unnamed protein product [Prorocentrum cordatum]|uniref:Aurora kinase n=1 Tax=Prorocentrum cordatum TaxID=2364126 RepID=A0ABN9VIW9_9DINO|nr:unnamed protein product [Polarella glacialis]
MKHEGPEPVHSDFVLLARSSIPPQRKDFELDDFEVVGKPLGCGAIGSVSRVVQKGTGRFFAMKVMSKTKVLEFDLLANVEREIAAQQKLRHPNILRLYKCFESQEGIHLLLEYASNGSLFELLRDHGREAAASGQERLGLPEALAAGMFRSVAEAVHFLHCNGFMHRDLKPENILVCEGGELKLADFGWCNMLEGVSRRTFCGTMEYVSPEMLASEPHDCMVDVWAAGVLLFEMLVGRSPFAAVSHLQMIANITKVAYEFPHHVSVSARDLVGRLLVKEPRGRLDLGMAAEHPWVRQHISEAAGATQGGAGPSVKTPRSASVPSPRGEPPDPCGGAAREAAAPVPPPGASARARSSGGRMRAPDSPEGRAAGRAADRPTGPPEASPEARPAAAGSRGAAGPPEAGPPERDGPPQSSSQPAAQACDSGPCEGPGRGPPEGVPQAQEAHALLGRAVRTSDAEQDAPGARPAAGGGRRPGGPGAGRGAPVAGGGGAEGRGPGAPDGRHAEAVAEGSDLFLALGEAGRLDFSKDRELVEHARDVLASLSGDAEDGCGPAAREPSEPALGSTAAGSEVQPGLEVPPAGPADDSAPAQAPRRSACGLAQAFGASPRSECRSSFSSGGVSPTACPHPAGVGLRERLAAQKRRSDGEALDACSLTSRSTVSSVCAGDPIGSAAAPLPRQSLSSPHGRGALLGEDAAEEGAPAWASPKRTGPRRSQSPGSPWTSQVQSEEDMADDALDDFDSLMLEGGRPSCAQECCIS